LHCRARLSNADENWRADLELLVIVSCHGKFNSITT